METQEDIDIKYNKWLKEYNISNLTATQSDFAKYLLTEENVKILNQIGDLNSIFFSVRKFIKENKI